MEGRSSKQYLPIAAIIKELEYSPSTRLLIQTEVEYMNSHYM